jgi:glycosyltransferase involved in cell wall biosynthesis
VVSVIIVARSHPDALRRALRSVRAQRDATWEAVVVDDSSNAGLIPVARAFGDQRIRAYRNPVPGDAVAARNAALGVARGAVIALLRDTDHWTDAAHLSRVCASLKHGEALVHQGGWLECEGERFPYAPRLEATALDTGNPLLESALAYPAVMHDWLGAFDATLPHGWLWDWCLRVAALGVPLRSLDALSVVAQTSSDLTDPAGHARDLEALALKHGLRNPRPSHPWAQRHAHAAREPSTAT